MTVIEDSEAAASRDSKVTSPWQRFNHTWNQIKQFVRSSLFDGVDPHASALIWLSGSGSQLEPMRNTEFFSYTF